MVPSPASGVSLKASSVHSVDMMICALFYQVRVTKSEVLNRFCIFLFPFFRGRKCLQKVSKNLLLLGMVPRVVRAGTCAFAFFAAGLVFSPSSLRVCQITTTTTTTTAGVSNHRRRRHAREEKTAGTIGKVVVVVFNSSRGLSSNKKNSKSQNIPLFSLDVKYVGWRKSTHTRTHTKKENTQTNPKP